MSRSTSQSSTATSTTGPGVSRSLSVKTTTKTQPLSLVISSDITLFVTNLRLLDFDLRDDWPNVTVQTFSAKNADQKQRISGTEWALFRLFEIWDSNETAQKLQPFFPPLEPLQSLNLRAALYRSLNELKKNGILGRETVLRKTMLDECKGEKFYEIMAIFSNAVLKKAISERTESHGDGSIARQLATAPILSAEQQRSMLPLAIAHKAALVNLLKRKELKRTRYMEFERLLDARAEEIKRRIQRTKDTPRAKMPAIPQREGDAIKKQLQDHWIGDQKWLDVMLHGDDVQTQDAFLQSRFEKVWQMVEAGRCLEDVVPEVGLLQDLQLRVQEQQERLQKWKTFHERIKSEQSPTQPVPSEASAVPKAIRFDDHLQYQLPSAKQKELRIVPNQDTVVCSEYQDLLAQMNDELLSISTSRPSQLHASLARRRRSSSTMARSPARSRKNTRSEIQPKVPPSPERTTKAYHQIRKSSFGNVPDLPPTRRAPTMATPTDSEATLIGHLSTVRNTVRQAPPSEEHHQQSEDWQAQRDDTPLTSNSPEGASSSPPAMVHDSPPPQRHSPSPTPSPMPPSEPPIPVLELPALTAEEVLAEQIVHSLDAATPSPVKKAQPRMSLSLMERTRMSMARTTSFEPIEESPLPLASPELPPVPIEPEPDRRTTLLERTRLSMQATQSRPRQSLSAHEKKEKRRSRASLFPVNQFDTPRNRKSFELIEEAKSSDPQRTPRESLLSDEIDYDRVFKSRPRIATSPVFSPAQGESAYGGEDDGDDTDNGEEEFEEGVTGVDLGDVDQDEDDDGFTRTWADSPSRRAGGIRR